MGVNEGNRKKRLPMSIASNLQGCPRAAINREYPPWRILLATPMAKKLGFYNSVLELRCRCDVTGRKEAGSFGILGGNVLDSALFVSPSWAAAQYIRVSAFPCFCGCRFLSPELGLLVFLRSS